MSPHGCVLLRACERPMQRPQKLPASAPTHGICTRHNDMYAPLHTRECREVVDEPIDDGFCIGQEETFVSQPQQMVAAKERSRSDGRIGAGPGHHGFVKKGGRPVTWIGGGGLDPKRLVNMGVPQLRTLFQEVFGEATASNNAAWLRRKLSENPDSMYGQGRCATVRARDASAAIWTHPHHHSTSLHLQPSCSSQGGSGQATGTHMGGGSGSGASPTDSGGSGSGGDASYMATTTSVRRRPVKRGSSLRDDGAFSSSSARPRSHHAGGGGGGGARRVPISRATFSLRYLGGNVEVYWPDDNTWWAATVLQVDVEEPRLQLLYSNLQQEDITGQDLWDMMDAGHLVEGYAVRAKPAKQPSRRKLDAPAGPGSPTKRHAGGEHNPTSHAAADAAATAAGTPAMLEEGSAMKRQSSSGSGQADTGTWALQQQVRVAPREEDNNDPMEWLAEFSDAQLKALSSSSGDLTAAAEGGGGAYSSSRQQQKQQQVDLAPCAFQQLPNAVGGWANGNPAAAARPAAEGMSVGPWGPMAGLPAGYPAPVAAATAAVAAGGADLALLQQLLGPLAAAAIQSTPDAEQQVQAPPPQQQVSMPMWMVSLGLAAPSAAAPPPQQQQQVQQVAAPTAQCEPSGVALPGWAMPVAGGSLVGRSQSAPVNDIITEAALMLRQSSVPAGRRGQVALHPATPEAPAAEPSAVPCPKQEVVLGLGSEPQLGGGQVAQVYVLPCGRERAASPSLANLPTTAAAPAVSGGSLGSPRVRDTGVLDSDDVLPAAEQGDYISGEEGSAGEEDRGPSAGPLAGPSSSNPSSYGEDDLDTLLSKPPGGDFSMAYGMEGAAGGGGPRYCNNSALQEVGLMSELFSI